MLKNVFLVCKNPYLGCYVKMADANVLGDRCVDVYFFYLIVQCLVLKINIIFKAK